MGQVWERVSLVLEERYCHIGLCLLPIWWIPTSYRLLSGLGPRLALLPRWIPTKGSLVIQDSGVVNTQHLAGLTLAEGSISLGQLCYGLSALGNTELDIATQTTVDPLIHCQ